MPKVSVVIPTYNSAKYVAEAVESVISQTFKDWEIYVIDDGSKDNTREVLQPFRGKINYIYQENSGPGKTRNTGIKASRGKYIAFMDADDVWALEKLELQVRFLDSHPEIYLIFANDSVINESGEVLYVGHPKWEYVYTIPSISLGDHNRKFTKKIFNDLIQTSFIPTSSVMIRRECVGEVGYFDESILNGQDLEMWCRISRRYDVGFTDLILLKYRVHSSNFSTDSERRFRSAFKLADKLASYSDINEKTRKLIRKRYAATHFEFGYFHFSRGDLRAARGQFLNSLKNDNWLSPKTLLLFVSTYLPPKFISEIRKWKGLVNGKTSSRRMTKAEIRQLKENS